jgi:hypothetical protein
MSRRDLDRSSAGRGGPSQATLARRADPAVALQRVLGNRGTTQVLARKGDKNERDFEHSVRIGDLGPIELKDSNVADWTSGKSEAEDLVATTVKGKHSAALQRLAESRTRIDALQVQSIVGQNTFVIVTFKNAIIKGYVADDTEKTERWKAVRFDAVDIKRTSIGKARP